MSSYTSNLPAMPHPFTRCWESGRYQHSLNGSGEGAAAILERLEPPGHCLGCSASPTSASRGRRICCLHLRAVRTIAQALLALLGTDALGIVGLDWAQMLSVAAGAGLMSVLTAIVATGVGDKGTTRLRKAKP